jgi:hypothetical protein
VGEAGNENREKGIAMIRDLLFFFWLGTIWATALHGVMGSYTEHADGILLPVTMTLLVVTIVGFFVAVQTRD